MQDEVWRTRFETAKQYGKHLHRLRWLRLRMTQQMLSGAIGEQVSASRMSEIETNRTPKVLFGPERHAALSTYFAQRLGADDPEVVAFNAMYDAMFFAFEGEGEGTPVSPNGTKSTTSTGRTRGISSAPRSNEAASPPPQAPSRAVPGQPSAEYGSSGPRLLTASPESAAAVAPVTEREGLSEPPSRGEAVMRNGAPSGAIQPHPLTAPHSVMPDRGRGRRARIGTSLLLGALSFLLVAAILIGGGLWLVPRLVQRTTSTPAPITLAGTLLAVVQVGPHGGGLGLVNPTSARVTSLLLAPDAQTGVERYLAPAYTAIGGRLAYIGETAVGLRGLWIVQVRFGASTRPDVQVASPGPTRVLADCGPCNTLTWSADGQWLIYDGPTGLRAFNPTTGAQRSVTHGAHDAWPACSPDGRWLAYQHAVETLGQVVVVPARACFPLTGAAARMLVVSGYLTAWHPAWDRLGDRLAFIGKSSVGQRIYDVDLSSLARGATSATQASRLMPQPVSVVGCAEPVWIPQPHRAADFLLYVCRTQTLQRLLAVPANSLTASRPATVSATSNDQPMLFNPVWFPSLSA